jgi:hypothetical protein
VTLTREEAEALKRGDRVWFDQRAGRICEAWPTLVYVKWDAGSKQNEAHTRVTIMRFELGRCKGNG